MVLDLESEIEILLFDQNKIVTYKQLGNKFNLTPFQAKKELVKFISKKKANDDKIMFYVTYLIIGEDKTTNVKQVLLVNESDFNKMTENLKVLSKQIYSIQSNKIENFDIIYASDLEASQNLNRKSNLKVVSKLGDVTGKLGQMDIDNTQSDDELMNMEIPVANKKSQSKTEDQENKPVEKKSEIKKEPGTKGSSDVILKDMDQILPPKKEEKQLKTIFKSDAKKQKTTSAETIPINAPGTTTAKPAASKGKATVEAGKKQTTMMNFFKKA